MLLFVLSLIRVKILKDRDLKCSGKMTLVNSRPLSELYSVTPGGSGLFLKPVSSVVVFLCLWTELKTVVSCRRVPDKYLSCWSNNVFSWEFERVDHRATNCCCWRNIQTLWKKCRPVRGRDRSSAQTAGYHLETRDKVAQNRWVELEWSKWSN